MAQPTDNTAPHRKRLLDQTAAAWVVLGVLLLLTLTTWRLFEAHLEERTRERFAHHAESVKDNLLLRLRAYEQVLEGGAALFAASGTVTRQAWARYIDALKLDDKLPGIQGVGFSLMVPAAELAAHEQHVRAEGFPDYRIQPEGLRPLYSSILYLEPFTGRNLRAFGFDMYSEPVRHEAMERARNTGRPALSGRVTLMQEADADVQPGFLLYLPVYRQPANDVATRRAALIGFVYSPFRAHDMILGLFGNAPRDVEIELYDQTPGTDNLLFSSLDSQHSPRFTTQTQLEFGGRTWVARMSSSTRFEDDAKSAEATLILVTGAAVDLMLFAMMYGNARYRRHIRLAATKLEQSRNEFRALVENVPGVVFRASAGPPWTVLHVSGGTQEMFNKPPEYFIHEGHSLLERVHPDDRERVQEAAMAAIASRQPYEMEHRILNDATGVRWVIARSKANYDQDGAPCWIDGVILDITERRAAEAAIRNLAFIDSLTQLPNRRFLMDRLRQGLANSHRRQQYGALLFIDLDHFKDINDTHGHDAGDALLSEVANRLKRSVREGDTVARLGGDEFVVMLEELGMSTEVAGGKAEHIAGKVLEALNQPYVLGTVTVNTTPSIGITTFCGHDSGAEELLRLADHAMYSAKSSGRNQIRRVDAPRPAHRVNGPGAKDA